MNSIRNLKYVLAALAVASVAFAGCSKEKKDADKTGTESGATGAASSKGSAGADILKGGFAVLPPTSDVVAGVNVQKVVSSQLFKSVKPMIEQKAGEKLTRFKANCKLDPFTAIESIVLGVEQKNDDNMVVVAKGVTSAQLSECATALAKEDGKEITVTQEGNITMVAKKDEPDVMHIGWLDDKSLVFAPEKGKDKAHLQALLAGKSGLDTNKEMMDLLGQVDTSAAIWAVVKNDGSGKMDMPVPMQAAYISVSFKGGIQLDAGIRQSSADEAKKTVEMANQQMAGLKSSPFGKYLSNVKAEAKGSDVIVKVSLSDADLSALMNDPQLKGLMGMFMGGM